MSWLDKLYETYEQGMKLDLPEDEKPMPVSHTLQNAHINIVIDGEGNFKRAKVLEKTQIALPASEKSAGRSSGEAPHPLADKLQYVAADYANFGGKKKPYADGYKTQLKTWCDSEYGHPKARAVYRYVSKDHVIADLIACQVCHVDENNQLLTSWPYDDNAEHPAPLLFKVLPKEKGELDQGNALVCWTVEIEGDPCSATWKDSGLQKSWIDFDASHSEASGLCYVAGEVKALSSNHPAKLRHTGDKAKLISANDSSGYTFRGRFLESQDAAGVSFEVTQKAHNALRWLITRQAFRNGDQAIVAWAVSGRPIPELLTDTQSLGADIDNLEELPADIDDLSEVAAENTSHHSEPSIDHSRNLGQRFALALARYMAGYHAKLDPTESIVIMALDSATPGRMAITYYRDFMAKDYLHYVEQWHRQFAWHQRIPKEVPQSDGKKPKTEVRWLISAPAPWAILNAAYGDVIKSNESLKKNLYERLMPCIAEGRSFPWDLVSLAVSHASNRNRGENWEWERNLGVACALYRGYHNRHPVTHQRRDYSMSLDQESKSRDYLYGRLLAVAERIEEMAMFVASEPARTTLASRLMQRFADRPASTWLTIEKGLAPYQQRLKSKRSSLESAYKRLLDDIHDAFEIEDFKSESRLSGEYLLGFHCQRKWLREHKLDKGQWSLKAANEIETSTQEGDE
ncbi:type I-C CRISPR-associated protein Cas8c/Csd1 [Hahella sp. NBU794]|uniref:type I-C CRISPR-associated protein Cas8c/Csd1 n=1 Tax=Hahella sp. NBU794 TaxID=3422590 RepID=UPI003D6ECA67